MAYRLTGLGKRSSFLNPTTHGRNAWCNVKELFFDKPAVMNAMDRATNKALSQFGAYVQSDARHSLRKAGPGVRPSTPPAPPRSRTGLLKNFIAFAYEPAKRTVVIGPMLLPRAKQKDNLIMLEYGGRRMQRMPDIPNKVRWRSRKRKRSGVVRDSRGRFLKGSGKRSIEEPERWTGKLKMVSRVATYQARPFMQPAYDRNIDDLKKFYYGAMQ